LLGSAYSNGVLELNASDARGIDVSNDIYIYIERERERDAA
jgi:DNA polymerase III delta prime subunit